MKRISWPRICVYALIYFVTGVALGTATTFWFGPSLGQFRGMADLAAPMIIAALVSFAFAVRSPTRPFLHAALAYLLAQVVALAFLGLLLGVGHGLANRALEFALMLLAVFVGTAIGLSYQRARAGSNATPFGEKS